MSSSSTNNSSTNNLVQTWVVVADVRGREHLEARWVEIPQTHAPHATHATHAA